MTDDRLSRHIGSVLGPTLIAVTVSEVIHFGIWTEALPTLTYLNGMILFAAGMALVRFHTRWRPLWTVSITIVGWLLLVGGLFRLFFPTAPQAEPGVAAYAFIAVLFTLGVTMTVKAYVR